MAKQQPEQPQPEELPISTIVKEAYIKTCHVTVAAAGTPQPFETGSPDFYKVKAITIRAMDANTGLTYIGDSNRVSAADYSFHLSPGETVNLDATILGPDYWIMLTQIWIDAATTGNEVCWIAIQETEPW